MHNADHIEIDYKTSPIWHSDRYTKCRIEIRPWSTQFASLSQQCIFTWVSFVHPQELTNLFQWTEEAGISADTNEPNEEQTQALDL